MYDGGSRVHTGPSDTEATGDRALRGLFPDHFRLGAALIWSDQIRSDRPLLARIIQVTSVPDRRVLCMHRAHWMNGGRAGLDPETYALYHCQSISVVYTLSDACEVTLVVKQMRKVTNCLLYASKITFMESRLKWKYTVICIVRHVTSKFHLEKLNYLKLITSKECTDSLQCIAYLYAFKFSCGKV